MVNNIVTSSTVKCTAHANTCVNCSNTTSLPVSIVEASNSHTIVTLQNSCGLRRAAFKLLCT